MVSSSKVYVFDEVAKHNKAKDCWLIISGKVYDVSAFMDDHPGGEDVLISTTGIDATKDFEDIGHSDNAKEIMEKYCIGEIDAATIPQKRTYVAPKPSNHKSDKTSDYSIKILQIFVPILILALAFVVRQYIMEK